LDDDLDIEDAIKNFDIDKAHAFDQNEEYRLRYLFYVVGGNKVKESFQHMSKLVELGKISTIDYKPRLKFIQKKIQTPVEDKHSQRMSGLVELGKKFTRQ
jgi:hypothetical protein